MNEDKPNVVQVSTRLRERDSRLNASDTYFEVPKIGISNESVHRYMHGTQKARSESRIDTVGRESTHKQSGQTPKYGESATASLVASFPSCSSASQGSAFGVSPLKDWNTSPDQNPSWPNSPPSEKRPSPYSLKPATDPCTGKESPSNLKVKQVSIDSMLQITYTARRQAKIQPLQVIPHLD